MSQIIKIRLKNIIIPVNLNYNNIFIVHIIINIFIYIIVVSLLLLVENKFEDVLNNSY